MCQRNILGIDKQFGQIRPRPMKNVTTVGRFQVTELNIDLTLYCTPQFPNCFFFYLFFFGLLCDPDLKKIHIIFVPLMDNFADTDKKSAQNLDIDIYKKNY